MITTNIYTYNIRRDFEENLLIFSMESTSKESSKGSNFKQKKVYVGRAGTTFINRERKENLKRRTGTAFLSESGADKTNTVYEKGNTHIAKKSFDAVYQQQILRKKMKLNISYEIFLPY